MKIRVTMPRVNKLIQDLGLDRDGDVQMQLTKIICDRMTRYMPASPGTQVLAMMLKYVKSPTEIEVKGPYAHYQYEGEVWGPNIPIIENGIVVGWWSPPNKPKHPTGRKIEYDTTFNHDAGPHWDERLMDAEQEAIAGDIHDYIQGRAKR